MLELKNIVKHYTTGDTVVTALNGIDLFLDKNGFISILGPSGCGKTTLLNIIGGLDRYTKGDLIVNGRSTKNFKDADWDTYRNNSIGFIFQNYNLIPHLNVLENVELALTLSGVSDTARKVKAKDVLIKVGLEDQIKKRPNQLSGGQMQRVAIARAMVNDPDVILADEPTGALDSATSIQIMELLQEIAKERLIIMVTHNSEIAKRYSTRIIKLLDGKIVSDTAETVNRFRTRTIKFFDGKIQRESVVMSEKAYDLNNKAQTKKSSMSFLTSLKLSFRNLITKRARTILTSFAGSIGIIGIALVLAISTGFTAQINYLQSDSLAMFPLTVNEGETLATMPTSLDIEDIMSGPVVDLVPFPDTEEVIIHNPDDDKINVNMHWNYLNESYLQYVQAMDSSLYNSITYSRKIAMNIVTKLSNSTYSNNIGKTGWQEIISNPEFLTSQYDVLKGTIPTDKNQLVLIIDKYNRLKINLVGALGLTTEEVASYTFDDFIGKQFKLINNNTFYHLNGDNYYSQAATLEQLYNNPDAITLEIVGILRVKPDSGSNILRQGLGYSTELTDYIMANSAASDVSIAQLANPNLDVFTKDSTLTESQFKARKRALGIDTTPYSITIYPVNIEKKEQIKTYLDAYNVGKNDVAVILYMDVADMITSTMGTIINGITYILIAFAAISLLVSSIMIGIITYISVLERTKEIGVLRSLGARKKDISRVFNAETLLIGFTAGMIGVILAAILTIPINYVINNMVEELHDIATLKISHAFILVLISMSLTLLSGLIPSRFAAKKDPVVALRTE